MSDTDQIEPLVKRIAVPGAPDDVFDLFTTRIDEWWPKATHSVDGDETSSVHVEPEVGGRVYEVGAGGVEHEWGRILVWEPGTRVAFTWHPGLDVEESTRVEVTFQVGARGTEVTLVHDGWEARGTDWREKRESYDSGWDLVLGLIPGSVRVEVGVAD